MTSPLLEQAVTQSRLGKRAEARRLLESAVEQEPANEHAWLWLAYLSESDDEKRFDLAKVLSLNPRNRFAQDAMRRLGVPFPSKKVKAAPPVAPPEKSAALPPPTTAPEQELVFPRAIAALTLLFIGFFLGWAAFSHAFPVLSIGPGVDVQGAITPGGLVPTPAVGATIQNVINPGSGSTPAVGNSARGAAPTQATPGSSGDADIKQTAKNDLPYFALATDPESYAGQAVYYRGQVVQVSEADGQKACLVALAANAPGVFTQEQIWVNYQSADLHEENIVDVWGRVKGSREITTASNTTITVPEIDAVIVELE